MKNKKPGQWETVQSRRGVAIEMAMLFLLVVVALSVLLVSVSMMQIGKKDKVYEELEQRMVLEQIGEDFCRRREGYVPPSELREKYYDFDIESDNEGVSLQVCPKDEETKPVLTVELTQNGDGTYTVTKWSYGN